MDGGRRPDGAAELFEELFRSGRANAILSWLQVAVLFTVFVESALDFDLQWMAFVAGVGALVLVAPAAHRDWRVMLPWELIGLALLPITVRGLFGGSVGVFATYLSVAGLALIVTVELHTFTGLTVTHWFAVVLTVLTTLASVAAWTVLRWTLDGTLGTDYLTTNDALMVEWLWVALAGLAAGVLFDAYFKRRFNLLLRLFERVVGR